LLFPSRLLIALGVAAGVLLVVGFVRAWPDTIDDAYITFRYVDNVLAGKGLCYNPGDRVEGYSNPLLLFLLIPAGAAGLSLVGASRAIGLLAFVLCIAGAGGLTARLGGRRWQIALAMILTVGQFPLLYYSMTGLETGLFAALIVAALWRYFAAGHRVDWLGAIFWVAVALSRPEGILYPALLGVLETVRAAREGPRRGTRIQSMAWLLAVAAAFGLFLLWRHAYFGTWLPNTFVAKQPGTAALLPAENGWVLSVRYLIEFVWQMGLFLPLLAFGTLQPADSRRETAPVWVVVAAGVMFGLYTGGDWMPASRYLLPVFVPLLVLGLLGLGASAEWLADRLRPALLRFVTWIPVVAALVIPALVLSTFFTLRDYNPYHIMNAEDCKSAALEMRRMLGTNKSIVAHRIGALGYFSGMEVIDLFGLVDRRIAEIVADNPQYHPITNRGADVPALNAYLAQKKPDLVLVLSYRASTVNGFVLYGHQYVHRATFPLGKDELWELYERVP